MLILPYTLFGQISIHGKVVNNADGEPVANASVFLSNATVGDKSNTDGSFLLRGVRPGQYEFVISVVGFETYRATVMASSADLDLGSIKISPRTTQLKEVKIGPNRDWDKMYAIFKREFLGESEAARQCTILNPDVIDLDANKDYTRVTASSSEFIEIENKYLGYKIKYLLTAFSQDAKQRMLYFEGSALFEELPGSAAQKKRWKKRRLDAYNGSSMHFLRALIANNIAQEDFTAFKLTRKPDPQYPADTVGPYRKFVEYLNKVPLTTADLFRPTDRDGIFALAHDDLLYIKYQKKSTVVNFNTQYGFFDRNGIIIDPRDLIFEGDWGIKRTAELLPVDYDPKKQ